MKDFIMSNPTHKVVSGDTLYSLAKKYKTTVDELKKLNGLTSDTIKLGAVLKLPVFQESLKFPFIIAKSKNTLFGADSKHSKGKRLPDKYYTNSGNIYSLTKEELLERLFHLMETGAMGENEKFARDFAQKFVQNRYYDLQHTYSNSEISNVIKKSEKFKEYVEEISKKIKTELALSNFHIKNNQLIVSQELDRFHFKNELKNYYDTGLIITIDQVSYVEVELNNIIYQNGKPAKLETTFIIYDTYGLDDIDLEKYGLLTESSFDAWSTFFDRDWKQKGISSIFGMLFNCWWGLQYYHDCVPLLVKLRVENVEINLL